MRWRHRTEDEDVKQKQRKIKKMGGKDWNQNRAKDSTEWCNQTCTQQESIKTNDETTKTQF